MGNREVIRCPQCTWKGWREDWPAHRQQHEPKPPQAPTKAEPGWTTGPYEAVNLTIRQVKSGCAIGRVLEDTETDVVTNRAEPLATARLLASAPRLHAALQGLLDAVGRDKSVLDYFERAERPALDAAWAALRKAEGA